MSDADGVATQEVTDTEAGDAETGTDVTRFTSSDLGGLPGNITESVALVAEGTSNGVFEEDSG